MFSFSFMNTLNFHIYFYYFSTAVFLMRLSEKKLSFILVLYIHTQIFTMISFFFFVFFRHFSHTLQLYYTKSHFLARSLSHCARSLALAPALCFVLLPRNFSTLVPGLPQHSFGAFLSISLCHYDSCFLALPLSLSSFVRVFATPKNCVSP